MEEELKIFVLPRGWVIVGVIDGMSDDLLGLKLKKCGTIRLWGTTKGLGELAMKGPQSGTIIDKEPDGSTVNRIHVYRTIHCINSAWKDYLAQ